MNGLKKAGLLMGLGAMALAPHINAEEAAAKPLVIDGFVEAYYKYNMTGHHGISPKYSTFDPRQNTFAVAGGRLGFEQALDSGVKGRVDLYFGDYAAVLTGADISGLTGTDFSPVHVGQAYLEKTMGELTFTLGHFMTHVGYELTDTPTNWNFSRARLFGVIPFDHTGLKVGYAPTEGLSMMAMVDNGNGAAVQTEDASAAGAQIIYDPIDSLSLVVNYYYEPAKATDGTWESIHYVQLLATYSVTDALTLGANYLSINYLASDEEDDAGNPLGSGADAQLNGYALYANYDFESGFGITLRGEGIYDPEGAFLDGFPDGQADFSYTGTLRYKEDRLTHYVEVRSDASNQEIFLPKGGETEMKKNEITVTYGATYSF